MVSPIASRPSPAVQSHAQTAAAAETRAAPGKSGQSIGHQAKAAIAAAAGLDFRPNIQGKIASMMARHLDVSTVLSPGDPPTPPVMEKPVEDVPVDEPVADPVVAAADAAEDAAVLLAADITEPPEVTS